MWDSHFALQTLNALGDQQAVVPARLCGTTGTTVNKCPTPNRVVSAGRSPSPEPRTRTAGSPPRSDASPPRSVSRLAGSPPVHGAAAANFLADAQSSSPVAAGAAVATEDAAAADAAAAEAAERQEADAAAIAGLQAELDATR